MVHRGVNIFVTLIIGIVVGIIVCTLMNNTTVKSAENFSDYMIQGVEQVPRGISVADLSNPTPDAASSGIGNFDPSNPVENDVYAAVGSNATGVTGDVAEAPKCFPRDRLTAEDLLPKDAANTKWAQLNPSGQGDVQDQNFLTAGYHVGVNTQGQSLRNANYQLRSEPANPQKAVSPWNIATIEPDINRKALEIGGEY